MKEMQQPAKRTKPKPKPKPSSYHRTEKETVACSAQGKRAVRVLRRLRAVSVAGDGTDESGTAKVVFHLVDAGRLRESGKMEALLGEGLGETRGG